MTVGQKVLLFFQKNRVFRAFFLLLCVMLAIGVVRSVSSLVQKQGIVAERKSVLEAEETKKRELQEKLREATSAGFIERAAREKLGLVREGETIVIMDKSQGASSAGQPSQDVPSWKQWWKLFF